MHYPLKKLSVAVAAATFGATLSSAAMAVNSTEYSFDVEQQILIHQVNQNQRQASPLPKRFIVKYRDSESFVSFGQSKKEQVKSKTLALKGKIKHEYQDLNILAAELSDAAVSELRNDASVEYVEEDLPRRFMAQTVPYGIGMVQADQVDDGVAAAVAGGKKVCVIDSGLELPHEDMGNQGGTINGTNNSGTGNWYDHGVPTLPVQSAR
jgi:serine protease